ncbi:MAG: PIN domain-containing protein [Treponema sp.]|jgi:predicted nucleic acid-binding protein|nr:PIN domain-containing protein [Treponema sp.]
MFENEAIAISKATKLKLPDAIIRATVIVYGAEVISSDPHFLKYAYPALRILKTP